MSNSEAPGGTGEGRDHTITRLGAYLIAPDPFGWDSRVVPLSVFRIDLSGGGHLLPAEWVIEPVEPMN